MLPNLITYLIKFDNFVAKMCFLNCLKGRPRSRIFHFRKAREISKRKYVRFRFSWPKIVRRLSVVLSIELWCFKCEIFGHGKFVWAKLKMIEIIWTILLNFSWFRFHTSNTTIYTSNLKQGFWFVLKIYLVY